ncbi:hypothetical protein KKB11_03360, partial [Candidatus Micrarchaeota archaeon]|nr:hypothetical protein [Candidatus Micrarchaeota archaeon]
LDTSCLICIFSEIDFPSVLHKWIGEGYKICIPFEVFSELQDNYKTKSKVENEIKSDKIKVLNKIEEQKIEILKNRFPILGKGELSVIVIAKELEDSKKKYYAVLDDKKARETAKKLQINFTGSYGLIKALLDKKLINQELFEQLVKKMKESNFRMIFKGNENEHRN